ncbi:MAG: hypothetical protein EZS28_035819, partial [Streblomastix strix]
GLYLSNDFMGFVFTNFLEELWPFSKHALVQGDDVGHKQNVMGYISEKGPYIGVSIGSVDQITSIKGNTHLAIAGVYYTDYEPLKRATNDVNGDGKINILDDWHVNSVIDGMKSMSRMQDVVQKQTEAIGDGVQPYNPSIPPRLSKLFPIKTSYTSFAGTIQINGNDTPDVVANQGSVIYPIDLCDISGITEVSRDQLLALAHTQYDLDAFKIYIIDDTVNKLVMFNMHLRQKGFIESKQYLLNIPSAYLTAGNTDNPARRYIHISSQLKADNRNLQQSQIDSTKIGQGANWASQHIQKPFNPFIDAIAPPIVNKGLQAASSGLDVIYSNHGQDRVTNMTNSKNDVGNFIDEPAVRQSIQNNRYIRLNPNVPRNIDRAMGTHLAIPSNQTINDSRYSIQEIGENDF